MSVAHSIKLLRPSKAARGIGAAALLLAAGFGHSLLAQAAAMLPYQNQSLPIQQRVDDLVGRMTLEEKAAQMVNTAPAIPRLGVPAYDYWSEGLHGAARSGYSTLFPQAIGNAATFDEPLLGRIGEVISTEARAKFNEAVRHDIHSIYYGLTIWSPNINIFRDPRWGRGQETYGEDPFLTAQLGTAFVKGIQGTDPAFYRAIATPKHFAVHSGPESTRHSANIDPNTHDLWDTYLPAFRATIVEGKADSIMCAYNSVNGEPACASKLLLTDILRRDWNFQGFVTSDCGAIADFTGSDPLFNKQGHGFSKTDEQAAAAGVRAGTDTNCGDTYLKLPAAVKQGLVTEAEIDTDLRRLFTARFKLGLFNDPASMPYSKLPFSEVNSPAHAAIALQAARESMVLLKNDHNTLPLDLAKSKTVAVIGPTANDFFAVVGNYYAIPKDPPLPVDGLVQAAGQRARILYAEGAPYAEGLYTVVPRSFLAPRSPSKSGTRLQGLQAQYFANAHLQGKPAFERLDKEISFDWNGATPGPGISSNEFSARWIGELSAPAPGDYTYTVRLGDCYPCHDYESVLIAVDGEQRLDFRLDASAMEGRDSATKTFTIHFPDSKPLPIAIEYTHRSKLFGAGITFQWNPPVAPLLAQAVQTAKEADTVIAFVGLNPNLEGEESPLHIPGFFGGDRTDIALPAAQQHMLEALKATGKPLVVVLMNGSALAVNWAQNNADAILEAWYPGQGGAQAIAETLTGKNNPGGRLPVTFYRGVADLPAFTDYTMANRTYRYFKGKPLYGFGYGLSYTTFAYSNVRLASDRVRAGDSLTVQADVKNTGSRAGDEVAQIYLTPPQNGTNPAYSLQGFQRLHLQPGQTRHISFTLNPRQMSNVNPAGERAVRPGTYHVSIGGGQPVQAEADSASFTITGTEVQPH